MPSRALLAALILALPGLGLAQDVGLDLPVQPPIFNPNPPKPSGRGVSFSGLGMTRPVPPAPHEEPDGDDPKDTPPPTFYGEEIEAESDAIVFVLDASGSMSGPYPSATYVDLAGEAKQGSRWDRMVVEVARALDSLAENWRFNVYLFQCYTWSWDWSPELRQATEANKKAALGFVSRYAPGGGTGTGPAVSLAIMDADAQGADSAKIVLLTDGGPNCPWGWSNTTEEEHLKRIREVNTAGHSIDCFGVSPQAWWRGFCQEIAKQNSGSYVEID